MKRPQKTILRWSSKMRSGAETSEKTDALHILFIAAEADPFVKIGGLGDVAGSLPVALHNLGISESSPRKLDIRLAIPYYGVIQKQNLKLKKIASYPVSTNNGSVLAEVYETRHEGITVYFISGEPIHPEDPVYGKDFVADAEKFIFFSLACLELPKVLKWPINILHANDWHTAVAVHQLQTIKKRDPFFRNSFSIITLHNLPFMGSGSEPALQKYNIKPSIDPALPDWGKYLPLPMGFAAADQIVAVSPTYSQEILAPEFGCNLQDFFAVNQKKLTGILNGLNVHFWNSSTDPLVEQKYGITSLEKKKLNKLSLQREVGFDENPEIPLLILISRMDTQKGIDLAAKALRIIRHLPWQAILLGSGDVKLEQLCQSLENDLNDKVRTRIAFDTKFTHRMYSGGDILLMPSRYEPCGLTQMIAMRYGCIPVGRATGGLLDTIINHSEFAYGTGFLFDAIDPKVFAASLMKAITCFGKTTEWAGIQKRAMQTDFSWHRSALEYAHLYNKLANKE